MKKALVAGALAVLVLSGCGVPARTQPGLPPSYPPNKPAAEETLTYLVEGTATKVRIHVSSDGGSSSLANQALPWTKTVPAEGWGTSFFITATNEGKSGTITCKVIDNTDGKVLKQATGEGQFGSASCIGIAS